MTDTFDSNPVGYSFDEDRWSKIKSEYNRHDWDIVIGDLDTRQIAMVKESIISMQVSYSMNMVTQLSVSMFDPGFEMLKANYFLIGRDIIYRTRALPTSNEIDNQVDVGNFASEKPNYYELKLEIGDVSVAGGGGSSPIISIQARSKPVQQMQRYKKANELKAAQAKITGKNAPIGLLQYICYSFGLKLVADPLITKTSQITVSTDAKKSSDSAWDVVSRIASDNNCAVFEVDGTLYVAKLKTLYGKWGTVNLSAAIFSPKTNTISVQNVNAIPIIYPPPAGKLAAKGMPRYEDFILVDMPNISKSDKDPYQCQASINLDRFAGTTIRPGMTVALYGIPTLSDVFLVSDVSYDEMSPNPVSVTLIKPERDTNEKDLAIQDYLVGGRYLAAEAPTTAL